MGEGAYLICAFSICECCGWVMFLSCLYSREIRRWSGLGLMLCVHSDDTLLLCNSTCKCWNGSLIWLLDESGRCRGLLRTSGSCECCWSSANRVYCFCKCVFQCSPLLTAQPTNLRSRSSRIRKILVYKDLDLFQLLWYSPAYTHIQHSKSDSLLPTMQVFTARSGHLEPTLLQSITWKGPTTLFVHGFV